MIEWKKKLAMAENSNITRTLGMLGLAMRAGKVVIGTEQTIISLQKGKAKMVLVSGNASDGTKKKISSKCEFYKTRLEELSIDTDELGRLLNLNILCIAFLGTGMKIDFFQSCSHCCVFQICRHIE